MAAKSLEKVILEEPYRFEFFQSIRLLEKMFPARKRVGGDAMPADEVVRFRSYVALDFPPSEIHEINEIVDEATGRQRLEMTIAVMGMVGVSGVLPTHYTELVLDRIRHRDTTLWSFLDIFTHRAVSLFYQAWAKYRFPVAYERGDDDFTSYLFDFAGLGTRGLRGRMDVEDESLLPYVGLIAQKPHSASALDNIVEDYFDVKCTVRQFHGQWLKLEPVDHSLLGTQNRKLGFDTIAGTSIWDQRSKFRLELGPMDLQKFQAFLPVGSAYKPLRSIVKFFAGSEFDFDVHLVLEKKQVPSCILTTKALRRPMLGWTSFLKTQPFTADDRQVVLQMEN